MIKAGTLRERVVVQKPSSTRSPAGNVTLGWATERTVWAAVHGLSGREVLQAMQADVTVSYRVIIRFFDGITPEHRILWRGRTLEVVTALERSNREYHELLCREVE